eukprot:9381869-Lingulodinium_polyedra.AAC.1
MPRRKGSFRIEAERWGERLTADYVASKGGVMAGLKRFKNIFVVRDIFSGLYHAFQTKSRTAEDTVECFKTSVGPKEKTIFQAVFRHGS